MGATSSRATSAAASSSTRRACRWSTDRWVAAWDTARACGHGRQEWQRAGEWQRACVACGHSTSGQRGRAWRRAGEWQRANGSVRHGRLRVPAHPAPPLPCFPSQAAAEAFAKQLTTQHAAHCPWRKEHCAHSLLYFKVGDAHTHNAHSKPRCSNQRLRVLCFRAVLPGTCRTRGDGEHLASFHQTLYPQP